ncbi:winged helix-turn-helix domain-containing protein [Desulfuromonas sp. AOP6]|uniref:winged helix-turn-helix domain-containing protein n=1 Tax=Desulfuromonas sp. AOP6 TaxID=1566351 RepID=UPI001280B363|nr:winged helix-turn-helix domain-containing protein [Desulfuromonas sp. AOP6]BCA80490.1 hypothetical protein AOP6_2277 [Desulfuromonas sp. AOP6]
MSKNKEIAHNLEQTTYHIEKGVVEKTTTPVNLMLVEKKAKTDEQWLILWQGDGAMGLDYLATCDSLTGADFKVFFKMLKALRHGNEVLVNQVGLAREMNLSQPNLSRSIRKLLDAGVILPGETQHGPHKSYTLNPCIGWKGTLQQGATEKRRHLRLVKTSQNEQKGG